MDNVKTGRESWREGNMILEMETSLLDKTGSLQWNLKKWLAQKILQEFQEISLGLIGFLEDNKAA